jgi:hypothetical protein
MIVGYRAATKLQHFREVRVDHPAKAERGNV